MKHHHHWLTLTVNFVLRYLTFTASEFAAGPAQSGLLTQEESFAILMNISAPGESSVSDLNWRRENSQLNPWRRETSINPKFHLSESWGLSSVTEKVASDKQAAKLGEFVELQGINFTYELLKMLFSAYIHKNTATEKYKIIQTSFHQIFLRQRGCSCNFQMPQENPGWNLKTNRGGGKFRRRQMQTNFASESGLPGWRFYRQI